MCNMSNKRGFTLIELLLVISIIGLLSSIVLSSLDAARTKSRVSVAQQQINALHTAIEMRRSDTGEYFFGYSDPCDPSGGATLEANIDATELAGYMDHPPLDPWGNMYQFDGDYQCLDGTVGCPDGVDDPGVPRVVIMSCGPNGSLGISNAAGFCTYDRDNIVKIICTR